MTFNFMKQLCVLCVCLWTGYFLLRIGIKGLHEHLISAALMPLSGRLRGDGYAFGSVKTTEVRNTDISQPPCSSSCIRVKGHDKAWRLWPLRPWGPETLEASDVWLQICEAAELENVKGIVRVCACVCACACVEVKPGWWRINHKEGISVY